MKRVKSASRPQRLLSAHDGINLLLLLRHFSAVQYRAARLQAMQVWAELTGVTDTA